MASDCERVKILALCLAGGHALGCNLKAVLHPVENLELHLEPLPDARSAQPASFLSEMLLRFRPDLLLLCLPDGGIAGSEAVFAAIQKCRPELSVIGLLENPDPGDLHRIIQLGAADFCLAPFRLADLLPRLLRWCSTVSKSGRLAQALEKKVGLQRFYGANEAFVEALQKIPRFARCDASVFIAGETGTGKEMFARAIHQLGPRSAHPFVPVNCGAIPSELVENELFGHEAGAFTGASSSVRGLVQDAEGGTLFLDEIDSLPLPTQVKFLRFLQDQEYRPLGARKACQADVRIIAASNADLEAGIRAGSFRADLFYRLSILPLKLPALRDRREDIPTLARHFVIKYAREFSLPVKELSQAAVERLMAHPWPGNVRELENTIQRALVLSDRPLITADDVCLPGTAHPTEEVSFKALKAHAIAEFETDYIRRLLVLSHGNISMAARAAKKNRRAFWQLMRKYKIVAPAFLETPCPVGQTPAPPGTFLS